jgi:hypothetical protein
MRHSLFCQWLVAIRDCTSAALITSGVTLTSVRFLGNLNLEI